MKGGGSSPTSSLMPRGDGELLADEGGVEQTDLAEGTRAGKAESEGESSGELLASELRHSLEQ